VQRIKQFVDLKINEEVLKLTYNLTENKKWEIKTQREKLKKDFDWKDSITKILYRPFDNRWILYHDEMIERSRKDVMKHLLEENIALCIGRQSSVIGSDNYDIVFVSEEIVDFNLFRRGGELVFPLYIYKKKIQKKKSTISQLLMFEPEAEYETILPNISFDVRNYLSKNFKKPFLNPLDYDKKLKGFGSKDVFYYTYAILYSNTFRSKYSEFLKMDFPRIPFTKDYKLFIKLGKLGKRLADLHLLKSKELDKPIAKFPLKGENKVEKVVFEEGKVYINNQQYFSGVKEEVWNYQFGGYQVCEKWLKDRKKRVQPLSSEEIQTYCKIVTALSKTIKIQNEIDNLYEGVEK